MIGIPLISLTPPHFVCLSQARTWISNVICGGLFVLSKWRREMIVRFVDIGGIVDHHCLNFLFIRYLWLVLDIQQQTLSTWNALWHWSQTFDRILLLKYHNLVGNVRFLHCLPVNSSITSYYSKQYHNICYPRTNTQLSLVQ